MIQLVRVRQLPPVHQNFSGDKRVKRNLKLLKEKRDGKLEAEGELSCWKKRMASAPTARLQHQL
jgi:hypothetical protein